MNAERFNARYPVGTLVFAYPGARPEDFRDARRLVTRTRSQASVLGGHTDVVWVEGESACIALSHVDVVSQGVWEAARQADALAAAPVPAASGLASLRVRHVQGLMRGPRLTPRREAEIAAAVAAYGQYPDLGFACCSAHPAADAAVELLAELALVRRERDEARDALKQIRAAQLTKSPEGER